MEKRQRLDDGITTCLHCGDRLDWIGIFRQCPAAGLVSTSMVERDSRAVNMASVHIGDVVVTRFGRGIRVLRIVGMGSNPFHFGGDPPQEDHRSQSHPRDEDVGHSEGGCEGRQASPFKVTLLS